MVVSSECSCLVPLTSMMIAIVIANPMTATPVSVSSIGLSSGLSVVANVVSMVVSRVSIDTEADTSDSIFAVEYTGL